MLSYLLVICFIGVMFLIEVKPWVWGIFPIAVYGLTLDAGWAICAITAMIGGTLAVFGSVGDYDDRLVYTATVLEVFTILVVIYEAMFAIHIAII